MISVSLNGQPSQVIADTPLRKAIMDWGYSEQLFAVAINDTFIARNQYQETLIKEGDRIDVVSPMQGG